MTRFATEQELAAVVVEWLRAYHFDVYSEVTVRGVTGRIDIVASSGKLLWAIETKLSLGLSVIEQALRWTHDANRVSVAVPCSRGSFAERICRDYGIGVFRVGRDVYETVHPRLIRKRGTLIERSLREEHKTYAPAGNATNSFYSDFRGTCDRLRQHIRRNGGSVPFKQAIESISHHYSSTACARSSLSKWIKAGKVPGISLEYSNGRLHAVADASIEVGV